MGQEKTLVLVDGSALAFRMFHAMSATGMRTAQGIPSWAVFGFFRSIFDLLEKRRPDMIAVCFDLAAPTFRHIEYDQYKAHRTEMPDDLVIQWPIIKRGVETLGIPVYELSGYEADDVIGTVSKQAGARGMKVLILTGDQDVFQLLDGYIQVLMPPRMGGGLVTYGRQEVFEKLAVWPEQVVDYKALCGDTSDNIPGVKGIGAKTAAPLLAEYQNIEGVYANLDKIKSASVRQKLIDGKDSAFSSKNLATIRLDVPLDFDFEHCCLTMPEIEPVVEFFREMELNNFLKNLPKVLAPFNGGKPPEVDPSYREPAKRASQQPQVAVLASGSSGKPDSQAEAPARQLSLFPQATMSVPNIEPVVVATKEQLHDLLQELSACSTVSVDLETDELSSLATAVVGYGLAWSTGAHYNADARLECDAEWTVKTAYIPVRHSCQQQLDPDYVASTLASILENKAIGKVVHNGRFVTNVLSLSQIKFGPLVFDTMVASYIANPDHKHGLKEQAERILGHELITTVDLVGTGKKRLPLRDIPLDQVAASSTQQALISLELAKYYVRTFDSQQKFLMWQMDLPLVTVLAKMEQAGVALDLPYLAEFSRELSVELVRLENEIHELAGHPFNINSTQQLQVVLFEELKLSSKNKTKSGLSTDAAVLEAIAKDHPVVQKILDYRQASKLRSTYVDALPRLVSPRDGRLHGEFNQTVTSTGRLSSSNPNLQNIPIRTEMGRRIRRAFIAGHEGCLLLAADYSQIELRLLAHMSQDELLIDAFGKNQDIHARTAMEIFDLPLEQVTSDMRRVGKTLNFALIYQQGAYSTAQGLGISSKEAQGFIDKYFSRYPQVRKYLTDSIEESRRHGYAETLWGRRRYFRHLNDRNDVIRRADERAACNAPLQGSAADLMKLAMLRLDHEITQRGLAAKLILQVHDELILEVPESEVEETRKIVVEAMGLDQPLRVPLHVDVGVGKNWMSAK